jgi:hypothetical protein
MSKREDKTELMAHWTLAWETLGRWQALNARLSAESLPQDFGWARRSAAASRWRAPPASVPAARHRA